LLALAKSRVGARRWKNWLRENCPNVAERTDVLYRRLAAFHTRIEQEIARKPDLSVREAHSLIATPKAPKHKPAALEKWQALSAEDKRAGLAADGVDKLLQYLPPELREQLADQLARVRGKTAKDRGLSARVRECIASHPDDRAAKYIRDQGIELKHVIV